MQLYIVVNLNSLGSVDVTKDSETRIISYSSTMTFTRWILHSHLVCVWGEAAKTESDVMMTMGTVIFLKSKYYDNLSL